MLPNDDHVRLQHILDSTREALAYIEDTDRSAFEKNRLLQHGLVRCIEVIGEASARLSKSLHDANPQIPWAAMIGMRNRIVQAYFDIDVDLVWRTATEDLPILLAQVENIVQKKKGSNKEWSHPHDPDARITKMKDGRTRLAHKAEHAVDMDTGALVAVTLQGADQGDTKTIEETVCEVEANLEEAAEEPEAQRQMTDKPLAELVADKGYHSDNAVLTLNTATTRTYISEPERRRKWQGKFEAQRAVYANRRRITGKRGKALMRKRGELVERSFAHLYDTGGMRRTHLRHHENILKRLLIHASAFNLSFILRKTAPACTPRQLHDLPTGLFDLLCRLIRCMWTKVTPLWQPDMHGDAWRPAENLKHSAGAIRQDWAKGTTYATGC